jgi:hypothetical protein
MLIRYDRLWMTIYVAAYQCVPVTPLLCILGAITRWQEEKASISASICASFPLPLVIQPLKNTLCLTRWEIAQVVVVSSHINQPA